MQKCKNDMLDSKFKSLSELDEMASNLKDNYDKIKCQVKQLKTEYNVLLNEYKSKTNEIKNKENIYEQLSNSISNIIFSQEVIISNINNAFIFKLIQSEQQIPKEIKQFILCFFGFPSSYKGNFTFSDYTELVGFLQMAKITLSDRTQKDNKIIINEREKLNIIKSNYSNINNIQIEKLFDYFSLVIEEVQLSISKDKIIKECEQLNENKELLFLSLKQKENLIKRKTNKLKADLKTLNHINIITTKNYDYFLPLKLGKTKKNVNDNDYDIISLNIKSEYDNNSKIEYSCSFDFIDDFANKPKATINTSLDKQNELNESFKYRTPKDSQFKGNYDFFPELVHRKISLGDGHSRNQRNIPFFYTPNSINIEEEPKGEEKKLMRNKGKKNGNQVVLQ